MKRFLRWTVLAFFFFIGIHVPAEVKAQPTRNDAAVSQDSKSGEGARPERQAYEKELERKLKEFDRQWAELKKKAEGLKDEAKSEMKPLLEDLRKKRDEVARRLKELKASSEKAWRDVKPKIEKAVDDLKKGLDKAVSRFK